MYSQMRWWKMIKAYLKRKRDFEAWLETLTNPNLLK